MNILFVGFYGDEGRRVVEEACKACSIVELTLIGDKAVQVPGVECRFLDKSYFRNAQITFEDIRNCRTVDAELCEQLLETELEFYKQSERLNRKYEFSSFRARQEFYLRSLIYFNDLLDRSCFDRIVMSNVPHLGYDTLIYGLAKEKKIPLQFFYRLPIITDKFFYLYSEDDLRIHRRADMMEFLKEFKLKSRIQKDAEKELLAPKIDAWSEIVSSERRKLAPPGIKSSKDRLKSAVMLSIAWIFSYMRLMPYKRSFDSGHALAPRRTWLEKVERKARGNRLIKYYDSISSCPDSTQKYVYFPLHKQPEATTAPLGGVYQDQRLAIRVLSYELPKGWRIYVKEFPLQKESHRNEGLYDELMSLGNVELIDKSVDSLSLVAKAEFTATVTGTAAWESFFMGKPSMLFGFSILTAANGVFDVKSREDVRTAISRIQDGIDIDDDDKLGLIYALDKVCFEGYLEPYKPAVTTVNFSAEQNAAGIVREVADFLS